MSRKDVMTKIINMANVTKQDIAEVMRIVDRKTGKFP
jgi:hypothetical protein